jgi:hypothetical protein
LDEQKSKHTGLTQNQKGFGPAFLHSFAEQFKNNKKI